LKIAASLRSSVAHIGWRGTTHRTTYVFSDTGALLTRSDKRFLSNSELAGWYSPGTAPITFDVDGYRFGCAICIESTFPEVFQ